jgi:hypothetical protein
LTRKVSRARKSRLFTAGTVVSKALVKSWGCPTGESMSKKWRRATRVPMVGAIGKTDYSVMYRNDWLPGLSRARWTC